MKLYPKYLFLTSSFTFAQIVFDQLCYFVFCVIYFSLTTSSDSIVAFDLEMFASAIHLAAVILVVRLTISLELLIRVFMLYKTRALSAVRWKLWYVLVGYSSFLLSSWVFGLIGGLQNIESPYVDSSVFLWSSMLIVLLFLPVYSILMLTTIAFPFLIERTSFFGKRLPLPEPSESLKELK